MGQPLPLPAKIPRPTTGQQGKLENMGIQTHTENDAQQYVTYTLPDGWRMVDCSVRADMPEFDIVDIEKNIRVVIEGCWKGSYDNKLNMHIQSEPYSKYEEPSEKKDPIPSQTDGPALLNKFEDAIVDDLIENGPNSGTVKMLNIYNAGSKYAK